MTLNVFKFAYNRSSHIFKRAFSINAILAQKEIKFETSYGHLAAKVWNESGRKTPILALHGWMDNAGTWDKICPLLDKGYPVYALDLPGHGYSSSPRLGFGTYSMDYVVTLHKVLHHFGWKKVILMGHSMGGDISLLYAGIMPDVVEKLIILDTLVPLHTDVEDQPSRTAKSLAGLLEADEKSKTEAPRYEYEAIIQRLVKGYENSLDEEAAKTLLIRNSKKHDDDKYSFTFSPYLKVNLTLNMTLDQCKAFLSGIKCDMLLVRATDSIRWVSSEVCKEVLELYKKSSKNLVLEVIEGTHHVHMRNPEPVIGFINDFLHDVPQKEVNKIRSEEFFSSDKL